MRFQKIHKTLVILIFCIFYSTTLIAKEAQEISNRFLLEKIEMQNKYMEKRFEQIDKRFEQIDKRFERIDKRFEELREDMNARFAMVDKRFEEMFKSMNARFAMVDKRFDEMIHQMDKRFERTESELDFIKLLYATLIAFTIGTPLVIDWRRRKREMENMEKLNIIIATLQELAKDDEKLRSIMKKMDPKCLIYSKELLDN